MLAVGVPVVYCQGDPCCRMGGTGWVGGELGVFVGVSAAVCRLLAAVYESVLWQECFEFLLASVGVGCQFSFCENKYVRDAGGRQLCKRWDGGRDPHQSSRVPGGDLKGQMGSGCGGRGGARCVLLVHSMVLGGGVLCVGAGGGVLSNMEGGGVWFGDAGGGEDV